MAARSGSSARRTAVGIRGVGWKEAAVKLLGYEAVGAENVSLEIRHFMPTDVWGRHPASRETLAVREEVTRDDDTGWRFLVAPRRVAGSEHDLSDWRELLEEA